MNLKKALLFIGIITLTGSVVFFLFFVRPGKEFTSSDLKLDQAQAEAIKEAPRLDEIIKGKQDIVLITTNDLFTIEYNPPTFSFGVRVLGTTEEDARKQVERYFTQLGVRDVSKLKIYYSKK